MTNSVLAGKAHTLALLFFCACSVNVGAIPCSTDQDCGLQPGGVCAQGLGTDQWCQYPDPTCTSGTRWSDFGTGDGLSGVCVEGASGTAWAKGFGGVASDRPSSLALDSEGNVFFSGTYDGAIDFGGGTLTSNNADIVVAKYTNAGAHVWSKNVGSDGADRGTIAVDLNGDVVLTAYFSNVGDFGGPALSSAGGKDIVLARYLGTTGGHEWSKRIGGTLDDTGFLVRTGTSGDIYALGGFEGSVDLGSGTPVSAASADAFVGKFRSSDGLYLWDITIPDGADARSLPILTGITLLPNNDIVLIGIGVGPSLLVKKLSAQNGTELWSRNFPGFAQVRALGTDSNDIFIGGFFQGSVDFGNATLTTSGANSEILLVKVAGSTGDHIWSKAFGTSGGDSIGGISIDNNDIVVVGTFRGTQDFGGEILSSNQGSQDAFVAKYTGADGQLIWSRRYGGPDSDSANYVAVEPQGTIVIAGEFRSTVDFGTDVLTSNGEEDIFLLRFMP